MRKEITIGAAQLGPIARSDSRKVVVERLREKELGHRLAKIVADNKRYLAGDPIFCSIDFVA